jgi:hypothetical protein
MKRTYLLISLLSATLFLFACGGGGGGDGETESISYTGLKTQASITEENKEELAGGIFKAEFDMFDPSYITEAVAEKNTAEDGISENHTIFSQTLANAVKKLDIAGSSVLTDTASAKTITEPCDTGYVSVTGDDNNSLEDFSGYLVFKDCVIENVYLNGTLFFTGSFDIVSYDGMWIVWTTSDLTEVYGTGESYSYDGSVEMSVTLSTLTIQIKIDYLVRDNMSGLVYMFSNYSIDAVDLVTELALSISGRYFHPTYGYVDLNTLEAFKIRELERWPYIGIASVEGYNSSLKIDCEGVSNDTFTLSLDADGDGIYETVTIENW